MKRPAYTATGSAGSGDSAAAVLRVLPFEERELAAQPELAQTPLVQAARSRTRAAARAGTDAAPTSRPCRRAARGTRPSTRGSRPRASRRGSGTALACAQRPPRAARSTGTTRCARRRTACRGGGGGRARRSRSGAEAARVVVRSRVYSASVGPTATTRTPGTSGSAPRSHWRSVRYVTSAPVAASRSARLRYQRSAPPIVYGYRQS